MPTESLLYAREYPINEKIKIVIPTVGEVLDDYDNYYGIVSALTAMPIDMMVMLDDVGIDFTTINEYELFLLLFKSVARMDTRLVFGDLDLSKFKLAMNTKNNTVVMVDRENDIVIDRAIHDSAANFLRRIHHLEKDRRKPANEEAKKYLIERARVKQKRQACRREAPALETLIVAMVNTEQYKYDYEGTRGLTIYQFNECVRQIIHKVDYDNKMIGVYAGTVKTDKMSNDDFNWLKHK